MALTQLQLLELSEDVEQLYSDATSQLLIGIAGHFEDHADDESFSPERWKLERLSQLSKIDDEALEIITANTAAAPYVLHDALRDAVGKDLSDVTPLLERAVKENKIPQPLIETGAESERILDLITGFAEQANDSYNVVNTVMQASVGEAYTRAVEIAGAEMQRLMQSRLAAATTAGLIGYEDRQKAVRKAISRMVDDGITGYVDRAGRQWSAEAYVNMVTRTTVHNAAIQAKQSEMAAYGQNVFQVSSHNGARPLCAPYQGRFYCWDEESGVIHDIDGVEYEYKPLSSTSYGEPAGLFGINCGHRPMVFVDYMSRSHAEPLETEEQKAENDRKYQLSQAQRQMERDIREAKTKALAMDAAGDEDGFLFAASLVRSRTQEYELWCDDNGRTPRMNRAQVTQYNRSISAKARAALRKAEEGE